MEALRDGESATLESVARRVGITKPGLMYHFPTKEALMLGLIDHVADRWGEELQRLLRATDDDPPSARQRMRAYLEYALDAEFDETDLVMFSDVRLAKLLAQRWSEHLGRWMDIPTELPASERTGLLAVRLIADGVWFETATGSSSLSADDRTNLRELAHQLLERN